MKTFSEYQQQAQRSMNTKPSLSERKLLGALGLTGEAGEVANVIRKIEGYGYASEVEKLVEELGDVLWSLSNVATLYGLDLAEIAESNIKKLLIRYPNGFDASRSMQENDE
jgi:NTP pyrophosphatase (non-canonical NTP hydrolase)